MQEGSIISDDTIRRLGKLLNIKVDRPPGYTSVVRFYEMLLNVFFFSKKATNALIVFRNDAFSCYVSPDHQMKNISMSINNIFRNTEEYGGWKKLPVVPQTLTAAVQMICIYCANPAALILTDDLLLNKEPPSQSSGGMPIKLEKQDPGPSSSGMSDNDGEDIFRS